MTYECLTRYLKDFPKIFENSPNTVRRLYERYVHFPKKGKGFQLVKEKLMREASLRSYIFPPGFKLALI